MFKDGNIKAFILIVTHFYSHTHTILDMLSHQKNLMFQDTIILNYILIRKRQIINYNLNYQFRIRMSYVYFIKVNGLTKATFYRSDY